MSLSRRDALKTAAGLVAGPVVADEVLPPPAPADAPPSRPFLTPPGEFRDVSRGNPIPHQLNAERLEKARLTAPSWRLEIVGEDNAQITRPRRLADNTAITFDDLIQLGRTKSVRFLKAMQCNNIAPPLGQGLWEGVPLRDVLGLAGRIREARRAFYWGFHNNVADQMFRSSLAINQIFDTPPGDLPPFVAYRLNGGPIPPARGGPVRMVVPWAHGFKSVKWLQRIVVTNAYQANDTYALAANDPESYLKTAAYFDDTRAAEYAAGRPVTMRGTMMVGWPGVSRVEYWLRPGRLAQLPDDDPAWATARWQPCVIDPPPDDWGGGLPDGVLPRDVWGFDERGRPREWPMKFSVAHWHVVLRDLAAGAYELRVRAVDRNNFAQPEPRPDQRSGQNRIQCKLITIM